MTTKVAVGIPAYRSQISLGLGKTLFSLGGAFMAEEKTARRVLKFQTLITMDICGVDKARNFLIAYAMREGADWLLMLDSDTWTDDGSALLRMIYDGKMLGATIIGAPVFRRLENQQLINVYKLLGRVGQVDDELTPIDIKSWTKAAQRKIFDVDGIGAAVMAMDLHKIGDATFKFTDKLSEDLDFCQQIRKLGGKIMCDTRIATHHTKSDVMSYQP